MRIYIPLGIMQDSKLSLWCCPVTLLLLILLLLLLITTIILVSMKQFRIINILKSFILDNFLTLSNVFKNKMNCRSVINTVGLRVLNKEIRDFSAINVSRLSLSVRCVTAANNIYKYLAVFKKHTVFSEDTISFL
jgi:hypothetical protein